MYPRLGEVTDVAIDIGSIGRRAGRNRERTYEGRGHRASRYHPIWDEHANSLWQHRGAQASGACLTTQAGTEMLEDLARRGSGVWFNRPDSKSGEPNGSGGSNPSLSANQSCQTEISYGDSQIVPQFCGQIPMKGDQRRSVSAGCGGNSATFSLCRSSSVPVASFTFNRA